MTSASFAKAPLTMTYGYGASASDSPDIASCDEGSSSVGSGSQVNSTNDGDDLDRVVFRRRRPRTMGTNDRHEHINQDVALRCHRRQIRLTPNINRRNRLSNGVIILVGLTLLQPVHCSTDSATVTSTTGCSLRSTTQQHTQGSIQRALHSNNRNERRRRRNNTGFYYGIRDDDMSFSQSSVLPSLKNDGLSIGSPLWDIKQQWQSRLVTGVESLWNGSRGLLRGDGDRAAWDVPVEALDGGEHTAIYSQQEVQSQHSNDHQSPSMQCFPECNQHPHVTEYPSSQECSPPIPSPSNKMMRRRQQFMHCLSQSLMQSLLSPIDHHSFKARVSIRGGEINTGNNGESILVRAMSGVKSLTCTIFPEFNGNVVEPRGRIPHLEQRHNDAVINSSITTRSKNKKRSTKRRKNNTGFYYGIREDVLTLPENSGSERKSAVSPSFGELIPRKPSTKSTTPPSRESTATGAIEGEEQDAKGDGAAVGVPNVDEGDRSSDGGVALKKEKPPLLEQQQPKPQPKMPSKEPPTRFNKKMENKRQLKEPKSSAKNAPGLSEIFDETLLELREMKDEIIALREELRAVKDRLRREKEEETKEQPKWWQGRQSKDEEQPTESEQMEEELYPLLSIEEQPEESASTTLDLPKRLGQREYEHIGRNVESWASKLLFEEERAGDGWKTISCNSFVKKKFNKDGRTEVYLKWLPDSREEYVDKDNAEQEYPCIKCYSTIDAPMDQVCAFLANEKTVPQYNELVEDHADVEVITPHSKITWTLMPKVLFVKPRDFVTFCSHRWKRDGTQVIVNQACDHEDVPGNMVEGEGDVTRGFALRGANCECC